MKVCRLNRVISWPPCIDPVEVKAIPGLSSKAFVDQRSPVESRKYLSGAAIDPKRVGEPIARPAQSIKSSFEQYILMTLKHLHTFLIENDVHLLQFQSCNL